MSIHKLSAGSGYDYLTRQIAALDATAKGHVGLASYCTECGESPGWWIGSGMAGISGLNAGDPVTAEQMRALFGAGMHPLATQRLEQLRGDPLCHLRSNAPSRPPSTTQAQMVAGFDLTFSPVKSVSTL